MAHRRRGRRRPDRARGDPRHGVRPVPVVRRDVRRGAARLLQRRGAHRRHGSRRCARRDPLPAAAHDEPLPRRRRRRLRPGRRRGVQQLPVRRVLCSRPRSSGRLGAGAVVGHRYGGRRAPQGEGARREGRDHLELAVRGRDGSARTTIRSGPRPSTKASPYPSTSTSSAGGNGPWRARPSWRPAIPRTT